MNDNIFKRKICQDRLNILFEDIKTLPKMKENKKEIVEDIIRRADALKNDMLDLATDKQKEIVIRDFNLIKKFMRKLTWIDFNYINNINVITFFFKFK